MREVQHHVSWDIESVLENNSSSSEAMKPPPKMIQAQESQTALGTIEIHHRKIVGDLGSFLRVCIL